jgi:hypothetical protein
MTDVPPPKSLFAALLVGSVPLLMGSAVFYFTSGFTLRCERNSIGHASCTEGRRILKLIDIPLRRYPEVLGAADDERPASDQDGDSYTDHVPVMLTPEGKKNLAPFGAGADLDDLVERVNTFAKNPRPEGLSLGGRTGGLVFFFHLFSTVFIVSGVTTFVSYLRSLFGRSG